MEIINKVQKEILNIFAGIPDSGNFYLTGGTVLSYFYLKHRKSNDLNFFTAEEESITPFSHQLETTLRTGGMDVRRQRGVRSFVELLAKIQDEITIVHLACDAPFRFGPTDEFSEYPGLKVDNLVDIATNKLLALFGRATLRDFIDIYFLITRSKFTAEELMDKAKQKDPGFDLYWLGVALERINTFNTVSPELSVLIEPLDFNAMSLFFNKWRKDIVKGLR